MSDAGLSYGIRAGFVRLMLHAHVVRGEKASGLRHSFIWAEIPEKVTVEQYVSIIIFRPLVLLFTFVSAHKSIADTDH